jgi:hypothetical protein
MPNAGPLLKEEIKKLINVHGYNWECISPHISSINKISAYHTFIHLKNENENKQINDSPVPCGPHQSEYSPSKLIISKGLFNSIPGRISQIDKSH